MVNGWDAQAPLVTHQSAGGLGVVLKSGLELVRLPACVGVPLIRPLPELRRETRGQRAHVYKVGVRRAVAGLARKLVFVRGSDDPIGGVARIAVLAASVIEPKRRCSRDEDAGKQRCQREKPNETTAAVHAAGDGTKHVVEGRYEVVRKP